MVDNIVIKGAREHNLKNIDASIPKNKLVVFTGVSGSGKSSLAFDTIYAEGQRRYVESLSSYARQFLGVMKKPDVESITGLSPAISIDQKTVSHNPRSTVGTTTEVYDYLRLLFARVGHPHCPKCGQEISKLSVDQIVEKAFYLAEQKLKEASSKQVRLMVLSPVVRDKKGEFSKLLKNLSQKGFSKARIDGRIFETNSDLILIKTNRHTIEAVIDRLSLSKKSLGKKEIRTRISDSVETALKLSNRLIIISQVLDASFSFPQNPKKFTDHLFSQNFACPQCNISLPEIEPRSFSFNSPHGACPTCNGLGTLLKVDENLVVNPKLSISEGGILPFARMLSTDSWYSRTVATVADKLGFSLKTPIEKLAPSDLKSILYGTGDKVFTVYGENRFGRQTSFDTTFEGVIPNLERRHGETKSDFMRAEIEKFMRKEVCPTCSGARLKKESLSITIDSKSIAEVSNLPIDKLAEFIKKLAKQGPSSAPACRRGRDARTVLAEKKTILSQKETQIAKPILRELKNRLAFLKAVGLKYLTLSRPSSSLAGGEAQRIRLASQIGSGLSGVLYVLDEPTIGLHARDNARLIKTLKSLRDLGNTVLVVEHDKNTIESADFILDFGPLAGQAGGEIITFGTSKQIARSKSSLTGKYLSGRKKIKQISPRSPVSSHQLAITGCSQHNLKNIDVSFPLGRLICVTGVSGSGKSTLVHDTLYHALKSQFSPTYQEKPGKYKSLMGTANIQKVSLIDQSAIGKTPRSNPATYTKAFDYIRALFAKTAEAKIRGYKPGRFSFNVSGGRCESCRGQGQNKIEMQFLPDVYVDCEVCGGRRYNRETLEVEYKGKNIAQVLDLTVEESLALFKNIPALVNKLQTLYEVGLGYIKLGQPAPTLSGGEAQRVKLSRELSKQSKSQTLYLLDEPTTGLHFYDLEKLLLVLCKLVDRGNTVIIIEHNLDVVKNADWIIDLGPEGGDKGGHIVATGTPAAIAKCQKSYTGQFLKKIL